LNSRTNLHSLTLLKNFLQFRTPLHVFKLLFVLSLSDFNCLSVGAQGVANCDA